MNAIRDAFHGVLSVNVVTRPPTWRPTSLNLSYVMASDEPSGQSMADLYAWAIKEGLENPRVISPLLLDWSAIFNPQFYDATMKTCRDHANAGQAMLTCSYKALSAPPNRAKFWLQSVLFLSAVTLSAAIVQSRWSAGTIASKYDKLWLAGHLAGTGVAPELAHLDLKAQVIDLAANTSIPDVERLLTIRHLFELAIASLGMNVDAQSVTMRADKSFVAHSKRFGFVDELRRTIPGLSAIAVYGSSLTSPSFADYDVILVSKTPEDALRALAGTSPSWQGKELNVGIYSPDELWRMQLLSGDNLADYGVCLFGEIEVPCKAVDELLARNISFGMIRQRQQLGMIAPALTPQTVSNGDDRRNLYEYFVKIPANIVKGTFGATGSRLSKEDVHKWMISQCDFDTLAQQNRARTGKPGLALAAAAAATGKALRVLNDEFKIVTSTLTAPPHER